MDLQILETGNGGDALLNGNDLKVVDGVENMPYLACFGGAEFWGNNLLLSEVPSSQFLSETEQIMLSVPLNSSGRQAIENAMKRDLQFLLDNVPDTTLNVDVRIVSDNKLECKVDFNGQQFYFLWNPGQEAARVVPYAAPPLVLYRSPILSGDSTSYAFTEFDIVFGGSTATIPAYAFHDAADEIAFIAYLNTTIKPMYGMTGSFMIDRKNIIYQQGTGELWALPRIVFLLKYEVPLTITPVSPSASAADWEFTYVASGATQVIDWGDGSSFEEIFSNSGTAETVPHTFPDSLTDRYVSLFHNNTNVEIYRFAPPSYDYVLANISGYLCDNMTSLQIASQELISPCSLPISNLSKLSILQVISDGVTSFSNILSGNYPLASFIYANGNNLSSAEVDELFNDFVANTPVQLAGGRFFTQGQTPSAPPTSASLAARTALLANGWILTTD